MLRESRGTSLPSGAYGSPDPSRRERLVDVRNSKRSERVAHGRHDSWRGRNRARLANAFHAERVHVGRSDGMCRLDARHLSRFGYGVIHHGSGEELTVVVVDGHFLERFADSLNHAAVDLALDDHRIDLWPAVVDGDVAKDLHDPGFDVHLHRADVRAERKDKVRWI